MKTNLTISKNELTRMDMKTVLTVTPTIMRTVSPNDEEAETFEVFPF